MAEVPAHIWLVVLAGVAGLPATTAVGLARCAQAAGRRPTAAVASFVVAWTGVVALCWALAAGGAFREATTGNEPWFGLFALTVLAAVLAGLALPPVAGLLRVPAALAWLTWPQTFRAVGVAFLLMFALGRLPAVFALPAGLGDLAVGLAAPVVARRLARGERRGAVAFHVLGTLDLVVALTIGALAGAAAADLMVLPLVLIPATLVPLALGLHVAALVRLRRQRATASPRTRGPRALLPRVTGSTSGTRSRGRQPGAPPRRTWTATAEANSRSRRPDAGGHPELVEQPAAGTAGPPATRQRCEDERHPAKAAGGARATSLPSPRKAAGPSPRQRVGRPAR